MSRPFNDLTGKRFGTLLVIKRLQSIRGPAGKLVGMWECLCDCGAIKSVRLSALAEASRSFCRCVKRQQESEIGRLVIISKGNVRICQYDVEDFNLVSSHRWFISAGYAACGDKEHYLRTGRIRTMLMHRMILGLGDSEMFTDHKNRNRLDNRRCNLRICNYSQNRANSPSSPGESIYRGVDFHKTPLAHGGMAIRIRAAVRVNGKKVHLGYFQNEESAAMAYDKAAVKAFGEFATLNFKTL